MLVIHEFRVPEKCPVVSVFESDTWHLEVPSVSDPLVNQRRVKF